MVNEKISRLWNVTSKRTPCHVTRVVSVFYFTGTTSSSSRVASLSVIQFLKHRHRKREREREAREREKSLLSRFAAMLLAGAITTQAEGHNLPFRGFYVPTIVLRHLLQKCTTARILETHTLAISRDCVGTIALALRSFSQRKRCTIPVSTGRKIFFEVVSLRNVFALTTSRKNHHVFAKVMWRFTCVIDSQEDWDFIYPTKYFKMHPKSTLKIFNFIWNTLKIAFWK